MRGNSLFVSLGVIYLRVLYLLNLNHARSGFRAISEIKDQRKLRAELKLHYIGI